MEAGDIMAKKKKDKKEEIIKFLNEIADNEDTSLEDKEKIKELTMSIDKVKIYSKANFILSYILLCVIRFILHYVLALSMIGLFQAFLVLENKLYVFLIPLGISILFSTLAIAIEVILKSKKNMAFVFFKWLITVLVFVFLNKIYPIFSFKTIWVFYIVLLVVIEEYFTYKIVRRNS